MPRWASDLASTGAVLLLVERLAPAAERAASAALAGAWPWLVAGAAFLALRLAVAGLYAAMAAVTRAVLWPKASS